MLNCKTKYNTMAKLRKQREGCPRKFISSTLVIVTDNLLACLQCTCEVIEIPT